MYFKVYPLKFNNFNTKWCGFQKQMLTEINEMN